MSVSTLLYWVNAGFSRSLALLLLPWLCMRMNMLHYAKCKLTLWWLKGTSCCKQSNPNYKVETTALHQETDREHFVLFSSRAMVCKAGRAFGDLGGGISLVKLVPSVGSGKLSLWAGRDKKGNVLWIWLPPRNREAGDHFLPRRNMDTELREVPEPSRAAESVLT